MNTMYLVKICNCNFYSYGSFVLQEDFQLQKSGVLLIRGCQQGNTMTYICDTVVQLALQRCLAQKKSGCTRAS